MVLIRFRLQKKRVRWNIFWDRMMWRMILKWLWHFWELRRREGSRMEQKGDNLTNLKVIALLKLTLRLRPWTIEIVLLLEKAREDCYAMETKGRNVMNLSEIINLVSSSTHVNFGEEVTRETKGKAGVLACGNWKHCEIAIATRLQIHSFWNQVLLLDSYISTYLG